jgi:hypothetical protein
MQDHAELIDRAIRQLHGRRIFWHNEQSFVVACLIREADWRPLEAPWWRGKSVFIIGVDLDGNFFLGHCDGTVRYWNHRTQADTIIAPSVREFIHGLQE